MPVLPTRRIAIFALHFVLIYSALILSWPLLRPVYRPLYCTFGNLVFQGGRASTTFREREGDEELDIALRLEKRGSGVWAEMETNSRLIGYLPTVSLIAFVLATPIPWKRRRKALLQGLLLVSLFVALRMAIPLWRDFSRPDALQVYHPGPPGRWFLGILERAFLNAPASWFVVPIFVWVAVAFRRADWEIVEE
ncbi:MAG: hypothetical protein CMJ89_14015 [Planctomycetes bacterium]|jgi:hypothetical protein|nr:hypothetical protein [Planctomycetota bacterium]